MFLQIVQVVEMAALILEHLFIVVFEFFFKHRFKFVGLGLGLLRLLFRQFVGR